MSPLGKNTSLITQGYSLVKCRLLLLWVLYVFTCRGESAGPIKLT
jgi:hypothetical protein